jgi:hypothetical protein
MAASYELPTHHKFVDGVLQPVYPRGSRRMLKEKHIVLVVFLAFLTVCFGAFLFVPDFRERVSVDEAYKKW